MKFLIIIFLTFILVGFSYPKHREQIKTDFRVEISYIGLPDPTTTKYYIDNSKIILSKSIYNSKKDVNVNFDEITYTKFNQEKIINYLNRTNWEEIPSKLSKGAIDGYYFSIDLKVNNKVFKYSVNNKYHPKIDSLLIICNSIIPSKKKKRKYHLSYFEW